MITYNHTDVFTQERNDTAVVSVVQLSRHYVIKSDTNVFTQERNLTAVTIVVKTSVVMIT